MITVRQLHQDAVSLAHAGDEAQRMGDNVAAHAYMRAATILESQAARRCDASFEAPGSKEPTRSILFLSAASMADQACDDATARALAQEGLAGRVPDNIKCDMELLAGPRKVVA